MKRLLQFVVMAVALLAFLASGLAAKDAVKMQTETRKTQKKHEIKKNDQAKNAQKKGKKGEKKNAPKIKIMGNKVCPVTDRPLTGDVQNPETFVDFKNFRIGVLNGMAKAVFENGDRKKKVSWFGKAARSAGKDARANKKALQIKKEKKGKKKFPDSLRKTMDVKAIKQKAVMPNESK